MRHSFKFYTALFFVVSCFFYSCDKEKMNSRKVAGVWKAKRIIYQKYNNGKVTLDSAAAFSGIMKLQNISGIENNVFFSMLSPNPFAPSGIDDIFWRVSYRKLTTINFFYEVPNLLINFSVVYDIEKVTNNKLILTTYGTGAQAEITKKTIYEFEKY